MSIKNLISYGIGDIYGGGAFVVIGTLFLVFLTDVVGLSPALAGFVLVIGKAWDAISDPLMGYISDSTQSRFGRRRVYFLVMFIPVAISFFLLWYPVGLGTQMALFYYYVFAYVLFSTIFTIIMVPYYALNADMTRDFKARTRLSGVRMIFSQISALLAGVFPKLIIDYFAGQAGSVNEINNQQYGFLMMGIIFGVFYALPWLGVFFGTKELPAESRPIREKLSKKIASFFSVFRNRSFRIHMGMYIGSYVAMDFLMALFVYYLNYYLNKPGLFSLCMLAILATEVMVMPLYIKLCNRYNKGLAYIIGVSIWVIAMLSLFFVTPDSPNSFVIDISIMIGLGLAGGGMIPWAILPSIADVDELMTLKKRTGVYSGMMTLMRKLAQAIALGSIGSILAFIGYQPNQLQTPQTLFYLKLIFVLIPVVLLIMGILFALRFKITPQNQAMVVNEIKRLRQGGKREDIKDNTRGVFEELTGIPYTMCTEK